MKGTKHDQEKPFMSLIPPELLEEVGKVLTYGAKKYAPDNWKKVETYRYKDALMRHLVAYLKDENSVDEDSGLTHLAHIACNVAFLIWAQKNPHLANLSERPSRKK